MRDRALSRAAAAAVLAHAGLVGVAMAWWVANLNAIPAYGVGAALVNATLDAVGNGLQNVRYALPASVSVYIVIVWANLAALASESGRIPERSDVVVPRRT